MEEAPIRVKKIRNWTKETLKRRDDRKAERIKRREAARAKKTKREKGIPAWVK